MALKKANAAAPATDLSQGSDEDGNVDTSVTSSGPAETEAHSTETDAAQASTAQAEAAASVKATVAVATAQATSTAVSLADAAARAKAFQREVQDMKGASDFAYGNYRVFKGNNGEIAETGGDQAVLGRWAKVRLLSWDDHFEISPGDKGASTKDFVAYSKDGKTVDSVIGEELKSWVGKSVAEYVDYLRVTEEFPKTKNRRFIDLAVALLSTDNGDGPIGKVIQVTLSESSIQAFSRYQQDLQDTARCVAMGLPGFQLPEDPFTFFLIREVAKKGDDKWTKLKIEANLPVKI